MAEISSARPIPAPSTQARPVAAPVDLALRLLQPLQGLLSAGESAQAEIINIREQAQQFQVLLRVTLDNGRQANLQASSPKPLETGSRLLVTALSDARLLAVLQPAGKPAGAPLQSIDLQQLPIGTLLQGKVQSSQTIAQLQAGQTLQRVVLSLINTPLAGKTLSLETPLQLPLGSLISAQVQGSQNLSLLPLGSRLNQLDVQQQLGSQLQRQGSLDNLFAALHKLSGNPTSLPEGVRGAIERLLGSLPDAGQLSTAKGVAQALLDSGEFLEPKLLAGQAASLASDLKANLLRLVGQLLPNLPGSLPTASAMSSQASLAQALPALLREALGQQRQQAANFPLPARLLAELDDEADLETLLKLAAAAISRLQSHQLSSLAQTQVGADGSLLTTWQMEIPMRDQQQLIPLQLQIQSQTQEQKRKDAGETLWRVELAFDIEPLGPLQVQAQLFKGSLSSQFWAERASTASLIDHELGHLRERLQAGGLSVGELACRQGVPPRGTRTGLEQRWVDEKA